MSHKVLITNHHLSEFYGSEIATFDIAREFAKLGWEVNVATFTYEEPIKSFFHKENIKVFNVLEEKLPLDEYDLIWSHHVPVLYKLLMDDNVVAKKIIHCSLSPFEPLEVAPVFANDLTLCLANSEETKNTLIDEGVEGVRIFPNSVTQDFIENYNTKKTKNLKNILIVSNHVPNEILSLIELAKKKDIKIKIIGNGNEYNFVTPKLLAEYDAVITIGRTVQYCLAEGIPVYCYDHFGGIGWINIDNIDTEEFYNFSGRATKRKINAEVILKEIIDGFDDTFFQREKLHSIANKRYNLSENLNKIIRELEPKQNVKMDEIKKKGMSIRKNNQYYTRLLKYSASLKNKINELAFEIDKTTKEKEGLYMAKDKMEEVLSATKSRMGEDLSVTKNRIKEKEGIISAITNSLSYKIGRAITFPIRAVYELLKYIFHQYLVFKRKFYNLLFLIGLHNRVKLKLKPFSDKCKNIAILNPYLPTLGGGEKHMAYLCKFFEEQYGENVRIDIFVHNYNNVLVSDKKYPTVSDLERKFSVKLSKVNIIKINSYLFGGPDIKKMMKNYDIFVNFCFMSKYIPHSKINIYECMFPQRNVTKRFLNSYDAFIANSKYTLQWTNRYYREKSKSFLVYPPVFEEESIKDRYKEEDKKNIILSVGRFFVDGHNKKQDFLVDFFIKNERAFEGYELHLTGSVSKTQKDIAYVNNIKSKAMGHNIFIHCDVDHESLMDLYKSAKIYWHAAGYMVNENDSPEKMEHFGITTVEAMSFGVVPIVIKAGGQTEIVENGKSGFLWKTEKELLSFTKKIIKNDDLRKKIAETSHIESGKFSVENFYENNLKVFNKI